jgi:hypothetical protein
MITGTETKRTFENEDINALIEKIKQGDREAFMIVTELYQKRSFGWLMLFFTTMMMLWILFRRHF